ncbi:hypothetical protein J6590_001888 [Homalodisca vitripennis]|nr:hypothetical protein J6590_001888 [Homalodisca vitripennis]
MRPSCVSIFAYNSSRRAKQADANSDWFICTRSPPAQNRAVPSTGVISFLRYVSRNERVAKSSR